MDDLQGCFSPWCSSTTSSHSKDLFPMSIDSELWLMAEKRTEEILWIIQPALASEQKREEVIDYIQRLLKRHCATEAVPFGSVPLKTYLPDGDIDLTALSHQNMEEELANDVCNVLTFEQQHSESEVKDVQYVQAQVKVVKCSVKNISVDISFNQIAGVSALYFLEQVDQLIGKDHLLKRSIILVKAWCFYESRILGAHHGLLSTYALEVLILCIINAFHPSLPCPLAVLYKFLEYYSRFDWDNFCVTINGPVATSSLPQVVESPDNNAIELLLSPDFLKKSRERFSVPIKAVENGGHDFSVKYINILDPLKDTNNLGRSVSKGNFHRIKCALSYGAQRLEEIFKLPGENMGARLENFFANTLDRNGKGERPDTLVPVPAFGTGRSEATDLNGNCDNYCNFLVQVQWYHKYSLPLSPQMTPLSPPSEKQRRCTWDMLSQLLQRKQNILSERVANVFVPRVPHHHPYASKICATASSTAEMGRSRGTGTYIPNMSRHPYKEMMSWMRIKNPDSPTHGPLRSSQSKNPEEVDGGTEAKSYNDSCIGLCASQSGAGVEDSGNGGCVNLSLDQFPQLPCLKRSMTSEINQSSHPVAESMQATERSMSLRNIQLGTFRHLPSPPAPLSSLTGMQIQSGVQIALENTRCPTKGSKEANKTIRT